MSRKDLNPRPCDQRPSMPTTALASPHPCLIRSYIQWTMALKSLVHSTLFLIVLTKSIHVLYFQRKISGTKNKMAAAHNLISRDSRSKWHKLSQRDKPVWPVRPQFGPKGFGLMPIPRVASVGHSKSFKCIPSIQVLLLRIRVFVFAPKKNKNKNQSQIEKSCFRSKAVLPEKRKS